MRFLVIISLFALSIINQAKGDIIIDGGFESGFNGWSTLGFSTIQSSAFGSGPTEGIHQAFLETGDDTTSATHASLDIFFGFEVGLLDGISTAGVESGSAIKQSFTANAGDSLSFDWNFLTNDDITAPDSAFNDIAFFSLNSIPIKLADLFSSFTISSTTFNFESGFHTSTIGIQSAGIHTIGFGVANVGDQLINSGLLVDNVKITAVPEPSSLILSIIGGLPIASWFFGPSVSRALGKSRPQGRLRHDGQ